jgi:uncharacterized protein (DUF58 family)
MSSPVSEFRKYLDPRTLAKVGSLELRARLIVEGLMTGMHRSPYQGTSVEFAQHRPYARGDDIRDVDWRVYCRTERLYVKQYQQETNLELVLVVDASESMGFGSVGDRSARWTKYDHATSIAAVLAYMAVHQQDSVGLAIFDVGLSRYFKPSSSPLQWKLVVSELQQVPRWHKTDTGRILEQLAEKVTRRSLVVLLSDFLDSLESIERGLRRLRHRKHEVMALQILDPQELTFPFEDVTRFEGLEESGVLLTEPRLLRDAYLRQLREFTASLRRTCRSMNVDFAAFDSGTTLDAPLSQFLAARAASIK